MKLGPANRRSAVTQALLTLVLAGATLLTGCVRERATREAPLPGIFLRWTGDACRTAPRDRDVDGIADECELAIAQAFAPELVVDPRDCAWDVSVRPARLGGGYLFAVQGAPDGPGLRVAYLPAYHRDCGWTGAPCLTRGAGCAAHAGDSEIVVIEVRYDAATGRWLTTAAFLSAHCLGRSDGRCRWYGGDDLRGFVWVGGRSRGAPRLWVAKGKHGNYPSRRACDSGHWFYDSCDRNSTAFRFPVVTDAQNIGSRRQPLTPGGAAAGGCIRAEALVWRSADVDPSTRECFWDPSAAFRGWQRSAYGTAPTPYARLLELAAGF